MTEEILQPEPSKEDLFQENPERFEDLKKCLLVVKRDESGRMLVLNQCETIEEAMIVEGYIKDAMGAFRAQIRIKAAQSQGIIKPNGKGNMMDFARRFKK